MAAWAEPGVIRMSGRAGMNRRGYGASDESRPPTIDQAAGRKGALATAREQWSRPPAARSGPGGSGADGQIPGPAM